MIDEASDDQSVGNLIFMMGEFEAEFPTDRMYVKNHMWAQVAPGDLKNDGAQVFRFGFTAYAVRLLQDVYFLDWLIESPATLSESQEIGSIESKKAESALFSPGNGNLIAFNEKLLDDPSSINTDKYHGGWLFDMELPEHEFLTTEQYMELLVDVWAKTQRTIKGQLNE